MRFDAPVIVEIEWSFAVSVTPCALNSLIPVALPAPFESNVTDVADAGYDGLVELDKAKALAPIDYAGWKYANPDDIPEEYRTANTAAMAPPMPTERRVKVA